MIKSISILTYILLPILVCGQNVIDNINGFEVLYKSDSIVSKYIYDEDSTLREYTNSILLNNHWVPHGPRITYFKNGKIESIMYFELGKETGVWQGFYENGKRKFQIEYFPSSINCSSINYSIHTDTTSSNDIFGFVSQGITKSLVNGTFIEWYLNDEIKSIRYMKDGFAVGKWIWYYENGLKRLEGTFKNGEITCQIDVTVSFDDPYIETTSHFPHFSILDGEWIKYFKTGKIQEKTLYRDGKVIRKEKY
jgi:antitoxin component YwqK of YwqJK toxin-antitoxin module